MPRPTLAIASTLLAILALSATGAEAQTYAPTAVSPAATALTEERAQAALGGFGAAMALLGDELFVGSPDEVAYFPTPADGLGAVQLWERDASAGAWSFLGSVTAADAEVGDGFGQAIGVSGDRMIVGAPKKDGRGAAYVFERTGSGWVEVARLPAGDADAGDEMGSAVAILGDVAFVGSPGRSEGTGAVSVYELRGGTWSFARTLQGDGTNAGDRFGSSISVDGDGALVGAPGSLPAMLPAVPAPDLRAGSAHLFERSGGAWEETARLSGSASSGFGWASVLRGDEAFVSAPFGNSGAGTVGHWTRDGSGAWSQADELTVEPSMGPQLLGLSLALAEEDVVAGAPLGGGLGSAFVFGRSSDGGWDGGQLLPGQAAFGYFGSAVAGGDGVVLVGSPGSDFFEGIVHRYDRQDDGTWAEIDPILPDLSSLVAVVGGTVECADGSSSGFGCDEVDLVSFLPVGDVGGGRGAIVNDVWGWTDPVTGHEIAIVGRNDGTAFVDLSNPENPIYLGDLPLTEGAMINLWRDMKVYADHVFVVADGAGEHGIQIFDLTQLRDHAGVPRRFEETAHYDRIASAHNIVINEETGFAYVVGAAGGGQTCGGGLHAVDIRDPLSPTFAGCFADSSTGYASTGYSHDAQCLIYRGPDEPYRGHEICFGANENAISIQDVTDKSAPVVVASATYPNSAYMHQGWISEDHRYFYMNDELDELAGLADRTRTLVWDIQELEDPILVKEHLGTTEASDHNLYVRGNLMYQSNYVAGLQILDVSDPENPVQVGSFDTVSAGTNSPGFAGSWSNYPFFQSGIVLVTSVREGLFVVRKRPLMIS